MVSGHRSRRITHWQHFEATHRLYVKYSRVHEHDWIFKISKFIEASMCRFDRNHKRADAQCAFYIDGESPLMSQPLIFINETWHVVEKKMNESNRINDQSKQFHFGESI